MPHNVASWEKGKKRASTRTKTTSHYYYSSTTPTPQSNDPLSFLRHCAMDDHNCSPLPSDNLASTRQPQPQLQPHTPFITTGTHTQSSTNHDDSATHHDDSDNHDWEYSEGQRDHRTRPRPHVPCTQPLQLLELLQPPRKNIPSKNNYNATTPTTPTNSKNNYIYYHYYSCQYYDYYHSNY